MWLSPPGDGVCSQSIKGLINQSMDQSMDHGMFAVSPMLVGVRTNEDCRAEARSIQGRHPIPSMP